MPATGVSRDGNQFIPSKGRGTTGWVICRDIERNHCMEKKTSEMDERPDCILDLQRLTNNCHGNHAIVVELVNHLLEKSGPKWCHALEEGVAAGDSKHLQGVCHGMKGAAATVFAWRLSNLALEFEQLAHAGEVEALARRLPELQQALDELSRWKAAHLKPFIPATG